MLDGLNRYTYCRNNPIRYCDPTGFKAVEDVGGGVTYNPERDTYHDGDGAVMDDVDEETVAIVVEEKNNETYTTTLDNWASVNLDLFIFFPYL